ncbi:mycothiol synthase [Hamadaea tsunoensis]|uniref:mycothiol synthase n=1 Tax=Hamadaea tsunoensis TaxID=53368 RepID=UPI00047FCB6F|nr:mycothiol synthase [Hamadaea tsunoensis]
MSTAGRAPDVDVRRAERLLPHEVEQVLRLAGLAGDVDGAYPLSEHIVLHLRHGGEAPAVHLLIDDPDGLAGYAHLDPTDRVAGPSAELVVHPLRRRRGLGRALVTAALSVAGEHDPEGRLRLWSHGDHPSAGALAVSLGFRRARVLWQMRRSLFSPVPALTVPEGVSIRAFRPGADDEAWLRLNNRAFADHPDQGAWTLDDLRVRMAEPWFDPDGFLLAERPDGTLLGFHWTKIHGGHAPGLEADHQHGHQHDPIGEVYILGVDPDAHGLGLGSALTIAGLVHLRGRGLDQVMLYADETNTGAIALYQRLGFVRWATDACYERHTQARCEA